MIHISQTGGQQPPSRHEWEAPTDAKMHDIGDVSVTSRLIASSYLEPATIVPLVVSPKRQ